MKPSIISVIYKENIQVNEYNSTEKNERKRILKNRKLFLIMVEILTRNMIQLIYGKRKENQINDGDNVTREETFHIKRSL